MSRSIKRKNYENEYPHHTGYHYYGGSKIAGFYTEFDWIGCGLVAYREPTPEERFERWKSVHSERPAHPFNTLSKNERKIEEKKHRQRERLKMTRYKHGVSEDVIPNKNPKLNPPWWW